MEYKLWHFGLLFSFITMFILNEVTKHYYAIFFGMIYIIILAIEMYLSMQEMTDYRLKLSVVFFGIMLNITMFSSMTFEIKMALLVLCTFIILAGKVTIYLPYNPFIEIRMFSMRDNSNNWIAIDQVLSNISFIMVGMSLFLSRILDFESVLVISLILWVSIPLIYSVWIYPKQLM